jgi:hypothetical protein
MKITQSFMKDMLAYKAKEECGHLIEHKWIKGKLLPGSEIMRLGTYFEYISFDTLPKDGAIPKAEYTSTGKMSADYARAHDNSRVLLDWIKRMGFVVIGKGKKYERDGYEGTIDLLVQCTKTITFADGYVLKKGTIIVIDVKYSGVLDDSWSRHGWMWSPIQREYHGIQAKQYHYITELPFFFLVKDSSPKGILNVKFFRVTINDNEMAKHLDSGRILKDMLILEQKIGFTPYPSVYKCAKCPLKATCKDKHEFPHPQLIEL